MISTLNRVATLLLATGIILVGHGLQLSLLPVFASNAQWPNAWIGYIGSAYFLGFVFGCIANPRVVARVGHIRSFMVMASLASTALLCAGILANVGVWLLCRFVLGVAMSGMYMVIESWLSSITPRAQRGRILAVYTMICLLGIAVGQSLMGMQATPGQILFMVAALFTSLSIIPIGLTRIANPAPVPVVEFSPRALTRASEVALVVSALAGLATGVYWSLGPLLAQSIGMSSAQVGLLMSSGVLGGALVQIPIGHLADRFDRRVIMAVIALGGALFSVLALVIVRNEMAGVLLFVSMFAIGASIMPMYALCIGHAADNSDMSLIEVTSSVLIFNGLGSVIGPIIAAFVMQTFGDALFFAVIAAVLAGIATWSTWRRLAVRRTGTAGESTPVLPRTTHAIADLSADAER